MLLRARTLFAYPTQNLLFRKQLVWTWLSTPQHEPGLSVCLKELSISVLLGALPRQKECLDDRNAMRRSLQEPGVLRGTVRRKTPTRQRQYVA